MSSVQNDKTKLIQQVTLNNRKKKIDDNTLSPRINNTSPKNSSLASSIEIVNEESKSLPRKEQTMAKNVAPLKDEMKQSPISFSSEKK